MKKLAFTSLMLCIIGTAMAQSPTKSANTTNTKIVAAPKIVFKNTLDSASYAFGFSMGSQLKAGGLSQVNLDILAQAIKHALNSDEPLLSEDDAQTTIAKLFNELSEKAEAENKAKFAKEIKEAEDFLALNKTKPGVHTTASGLQYEIINEGEGKKPEPLDGVQAHYKGTFLNGTTFDSSYDRGEPIEFHVSMVIKGWTEGLQLMKEGSKFKFYIPYDLAYGPKGNQGIPPYSTLIFEVELLKVNVEEK